MIHEDSKSYALAHTIEGIVWHARFARTHVLSRRLVGYGST